MLKESITIKEVVDFLNDALHTDSKAVTELFIPHVNCNKELAYHKTIECYPDGNGGALFGVLGLLCGIFGVYPFESRAISVNISPFEIRGTHVGDSQNKIDSFYEMKYENGKAVKKAITLTETIDILNSALLADQKAVTELFFDRKKCNVYMANHETIQCGMIKGEYYVGVLGLLNGMFGIDENGYGAIMMVIEEGKITKFKKVKEGIDYDIK